MATVSLSPAQQRLGNTPRRVPLSIVSNAPNSPFRGQTSKRTRDQVEAQEEFPWNVQPHAKRQALEGEHVERRTSPRKSILKAAEARVFNKKSNAPPTPFERQLLAARDLKAQQKVERQDKTNQSTLKGIKQWQEHYRRAFPMFVFYFEGIPEDVRIKCSKYARNLGACEEKFFSKDVTHVVTTRDIPADADSVDPRDAGIQSSSTITSNTNVFSHTINPSLLEQSGDALSKIRFTFEAGTGKRLPNDIRDVEHRKGNGGNTDILLKAKEMGMKVWQLEKFQRMIRTMLEIPNEILQPGQTNRGKTVTGTTTSKGSREAELSRMLRNERLNGPSDRDSTVALNETIPFKGPYVYIRDMDERSKPIMVRDYQKPTKGDLGDWPQFHGVSAGRCPFVPEVSKDEPEEKVMKHDRDTEKSVQVRSAPLTRANVRQGDVTADLPQRKPLQESKNASNGAVLPQQSPLKVPARDICPPPPARSQSAAHVTHLASSHSAARLIGGEPAASGVQPSNITSAIRSQMISSTAAAPGAKAGTSKEVHGLQRKVLQKNVGPASSYSQNRATSLDPMAVTRAERAIQGPRQTRRQAQQTVVHQDEDSTQSEEDVWMAEGVRRPENMKKKRATEKSSKTGGKPGYCENCRDKYDDFDTHIISRKHRKFALTKENWKDLDKLLAHLGRRLKEPDSDSF